MDKICEALKGVNVTLTSSDLAEIGRYWYMKSIVDNVFATASWIIFLLCLLMAIRMILKAVK
jgi:hypothetical protein